ncbi:hypothetical protein SAMN05518801_10871 [Novosphingobium sp. CF614]|uniref:hypothetical protein n=1 Tax=Novosphingobium sp. CF614 TaxID=1884364 RepID=UPI0008E6D903|nr:hypothetical protein [Novosphingobium sp. CF614]SFG14396.1 hypothetical protein SAMN05518801_10871 [Novosphingobium sp. CF614]
MEHPEQFVFFLVLTLSIVLSIWKGGAPERAGGFLIFGMCVWQVGAVRVLPSHFTSVDPISLSTDVTGTIGFGFLALQARRIWPIWATSLQILSLSAHFARWADIGIPPFVYAVMRGAPTFGAMIAMLAGTVLHLRRVRRHGCDPSWQNWSRAVVASGRSRPRYSKFS